MAALIVVLEAPETTPLLPFWETSSLTRQRAGSGVGGRKEATWARGGTAERVLCVSYSRARGMGGGWILADASMIVTWRMGFACDDEDVRR
ncbi:hypothetical protein NL676_030024 [Syzygium grande]|nr:hypothetical protein NL676_030024 [Syzygium grande]